MPPNIPSRDYASMLSGSSRATSIPAFLRRLAYTLAIVLGASGALGLIWSTFCLPLLYSSFSARKAISEQQLTQLQSFVKALKTLRSQSLYGQAQPVASFIQGSAEKSDGPGKELARLKDDPTLADSLLIEDMDGSVTHDSLHSPSSPLAKPATSVALLPRLAPLPAALASLSTQLGATQTTRTSLLSTLSSYTSHLHSQIFLLSRSSGGNAASYYGGVGLKSLGENLEKEGGLGAAEKRDESKETREDIRKEIRAIKGMLLSRRNFSLPAPGTRAAGTR